MRSNPTIKSFNAGTVKIFGARNLVRLQNKNIFRVKKAPDYYYNIEIVLDWLLT
jgi:hypothetical protein